MKVTLSSSEAVRRLLEDTNANWCYASASAVVAHLQTMEEGTGEEMEFCPVAIRCGYSRRDSALAAAIDYGYDEEPEPEQDDDDRERDALEWLQDRTTVVMANKHGVVIANF
jgi:hypothetical protein